MSSRRRLNTTWNKGATITARLERSIELVGFHEDEWYPTVSKVAPLIDQAQKYISAEQQGQQLPPFDTLPIDQQIEQLARLQVKSSTFLFDDQTYAEWVKAMLNGTKEFTNLLTELKHFMVDYERLDTPTRISRLELLGTHISEAATATEYARELENRIMPIQRLDKDLYLITLKLQYLLETCLLKEVGFVSDEIKTVMEKRSKNRPW